MAAAEYLVIAASLRRASRSRVMAAELVEAYRELGATANLVDLREHPLPICDGEKAYEDSNVAKLSAHIKTARVIVLAVPIYNFDANAAAKNLVELTGSAWEEKIVGFLCAAGGDASYMSVMSLANSLMLDFRSVILPRFVYATGEHFAGDKVSNSEIKERIRQLAESSIRLRNG